MIFGDYLSFQCWLSDVYTYNVFLPTVLKRLHSASMEEKIQQYVLIFVIFYYSSESMASLMMTVSFGMQVLLHILRAGYFLHKKGQNSVNGDFQDFPIRTIYFESPCAFPEINSFTYDTAATWVKLLPLDFFFIYFFNSSLQFR